ncbi:unnamed protein product [Zymoseptoria tritici ST99CH_3D1]|nr:unnamed protein product [Zymoseptoria tritici ST99CH_3D1]
MTETLHPTAGFSAEARMPRVPHTPPYTPVRNTKRRLEHSNSPASSRAASVHPTETVSPAKKVARQSSNDDITVEELVEGDTGYDVGGVYPDGLEEAISDSDNDWETTSDISDPETTTGLSQEFSQLLSSSPEADFEQLRRQRRRHRRTNSRIYKRSHSQSVANEATVTDVEAMADHDVIGSQRRLRRRTRGPQDAPVEFSGFAKSTSATDPIIADADVESDETIEHDANECSGMDVDDSKVAVDE